MATRADYRACLAAQTDALRMMSEISRVTRKKCTTKRDVAMRIAMAASERVRQARISCDLPSALRHCAIVRLALSVTQH